MIVHGECIEAMRGMDAGSVDAIVTDPPYGLGFMGERWDDLPPGREWGDECLRVLKPGGHLLAFGGTRTFHRLACSIEDAGFEIRDTIAWLYGTGFPKSLNLDGDRQGWGTALKPAHEPIVVARKPLDGTVAANVLAHGTGALNVDGCRVEGPPRTTHANGHRSTGSGEGFGMAAYEASVPSGRWPANVVLDPEAAAMLDEQTGERGSGGNISGNEPSRVSADGTTAFGVIGRVPWKGYGDSGGASRFFYCAKSSSRERNAGLEGFEAVERANGNKWTDQDYRVARGERTEGRESGPRRNVHPTVKPIALMRWLVRLVTPPGGLVLDPFVGSGTTGIAATLEGFRFTGIEREAEYVAIAETRIAHWAAQPRQMELAS